MLWNAGADGRGAPPPRLPLAEGARPSAAGSPLDTLPALPAEAAALLRTWRETQARILADPTLPGPIRDLRLAEARLAANRAHGALLDALLAGIKALRAELDALPDRWQRLNATLDLVERELVHGEPVAALVGWDGQPVPVEEEAP